MKPADHSPPPTEATPLRQASSRRRRGSGSPRGNSDAGLFDRLLLMSSNGFSPPVTPDRLVDLDTPLSSWVFTHSLPLSVLVQGSDLCLSAIVTHFWKGSFFDSFVVMAISLVAQGVQVMVLYLTLGVCMLRLRYSKVSLLQLGMAYCSTLITYAGLYWLCLHVFDRRSFVFYPGLAQLNVVNVTQTRMWEPAALLQSEHANDLTSYFSALLYFSIVTMSGTGFGDIVPALWFTKLLVSGQMLTNIGFQITIIAFATHHFTNVWKPINANITSVESPRSNSSNESGKPIVSSPSLDEPPTITVPPLARMSTPSDSPVELPPQLIISLTPPLDSPVTLLIGDTRSSPRREREAPKSHFRLAVTKVLDGMLLYSLLFECINICVTVGLCEKNQATYCESWVPVSQLIQLAHCVWLCWFSANLVWNTVQPSIWIFQSFTTVSVLFAGLYFTFLSCGGGISGNLRECVEPGWHCWFGSFVDGIYFSATSMSLAGYGDVFPVSSLARLAVSVQILIGVTYFNLIFGLGAARIVPKLPLTRVVL